MGNPARVPSVGCLLFLAADQLVSRKWAPWQVAVPCRRVRVDRRLIEAITAAATYLHLRDSGRVSLRVAEPPRSSRSRSRPRTISEIAVNIVDPIPPDGLPGALVKATIGLTHGHAGLAGIHRGSIDVDPLKRGTGAR
jgi:hypothetical protein